MAGPAAHIICALAVLNSGIISIADKKAFIVGTSFPDIRYLGKISRERTHKKKVRWADVQNETSSFKAGMLLHALIDEVREQYMIESGIYETLPQKHNLARYLKLYEDKIIYDWIDDWPLIIQYFDDVLDDETQFNVPPDITQLWHTFLQRYLIMPPNPDYVSNVTAQISATLNPLLAAVKSLTKKTVQQTISSLFDTFDQTPELKEVIELFYKNIVEYVSKY